MTLFRLFSTCRLMVEAGHYFLRNCLRQSSVPGIAAKTTDADAASRIHPDMGDWEEVMFRLSGLIKTGRQVLQIRTKQTSTSS